MVKNIRIALTYRSAAIIVAAAGFLDLLGVFRGAVYPGVLYYYTALSNLLAIILFAMLIGRTIVSARSGVSEGACFYPRFEMVCVIDILLTFCVFWVLLVPNMAGALNLWTFGNLAVHAITPLLCLIDYILFSKPRKLKRRDVLYVAVFPLCYVIFSSLAGLAGHVYMISAADGKPVRFPYFFFDFDRIGALSFAYIGGLLAFFFVVGYVFYYLDSKVRKS